METLINGLVWGELIARRSGRLDVSDRNRIRLRTGALALAGLPPVVGVADATREVRRMELRQVHPAPPAVVGGEFRFLDRGQTIAAEFVKLTEQASAEIKEAEQGLVEAGEKLAENQAALEQAKAGAKQLAKCAAALEAAFAEG